MKLKLTNPASREYETLKINLKTYNRILITNICAANKQFLAYTFDKYKSDIRNTWKNINEILSHGNKNTFPTSLNVNGPEITNTLEIANIFNSFFTNMGNELANDINYSGTKDFLSLPCFPDFRGNGGYTSLLPGGRPSSTVLYPGPPSSSPRPPTPPFSCLSRCNRAISYVVFLFPLSW